MNPSLCVWTTLRCSPCAGSSLKRAHNWLLNKCTPLRGVRVGALSEDAPAPSGPHQPQHITLDEPSLTCANILCSSILISPTLFFHLLNIDLVISKCNYVFAKMPYNLYFLKMGLTPPLTPPHPPSPLPFGTVLKKLQIRKRGTSLTCSANVLCFSTCCFTYFTHTLFPSS